MGGDSVHMKPDSWLAFHFVSLALFLGLSFVPATIAAAHGNSKTELAFEVLRLLHWPVVHQQIMADQLVRVSRTVNAFSSDEAKRTAIIEAYQREAEAGAEATLNRIAAYYEENFQEDELAQTIAFYKTAAGQRFCSFQGRMIGAISAITATGSPASPEDTMRARLFLSDPKASYQEEAANAIDEESAAFFGSPAGRELLQRLDTMSVLLAAESQKAAGGALSRSLPKTGSKP